MTEYGWYFCCKCLRPICRSDPRISADQSGLAIRAYCEHCQRVVMVVVKEDVRHD